MSAVEAGLSRPWIGSAWYRKRDTLLAKLNFTLLDTWSNEGGNTHQYEGWLRCKVE